MKPVSSSFFLLLIIFIINCYLGSAFITRCIQCGKIDGTRVCTGKEVSTHCRPTPHLKLINDFRISKGQPPLDEDDDMDGIYSGCLRMVFATYNLRGCMEDAALLMEAEGGNRTHYDLTKGNTEYCENLTAIVGEQIPDINVQICYCKTDGCNNDQYLATFTPSEGRVNIQDYNGRN